MRALHGTWLVLILLAGCSPDQKQPDTTQSREQTAGDYRLALQQVGDWQDVRGEVATLDQAQLVARTSGIVSRLAVAEGDWVRKGQRIADIADTRSHAEADAYRAQAVQAQAEYKRVRFLHQNGVYADARLEQAEAAAKSASARAQAAEAQIAQGVIVAPTDGRILHKYVAEGATVMPGTPIVVVTAGRTILRMQVPETLAAKLRNDGAVRITTETGEVRSGRITRLYPAVTAGQVTVDADMAGLEGSAIGRRISAKVEAGQRQALLVPDRYVLSRFGIDYVLVRAKDGRVLQLPVQLTASSEKNMREVLSGVRAGDQLAPVDKAAMP